MVYISTKPTLCWTTVIKEFSDGAKVNYTGVFSAFLQKTGHTHTTTEDKTAKVWNKRPWLSHCVVAPSNSSSNRTENKPVNSGVQDCSNSLILLEPDGHLKPFAQISAIP